MAIKNDLFPNGRTSEAEVRVYHSELDRAFSIAVSGTPLGPGESTALGREVAAKAKEILLEEVIIRYDRLLGQRKKRDSILPLGMHARGIFAKWIDVESEVETGREDALLYVYQRLIEFIEDIRKLNRKEWNDARLVWIPFQLALLPEQYDSHAELDRLIERATREDFTNGNRVWYIINEKFQFEVKRMILDAEDYHVLWLHDFRGVNAGGDPDEVAYSQVVDSYFAAMIKHVRTYDETGKFPLYLIIQDQFYYEANKSKRWHDLLQNPLDHEINLPKDFEWMEEGIAKAQDELRAAVAESHLLQVEAREYGDEWLKNRIKVHVNITNPADASYWSQYVLPIVGIHDNYIRDHRKISFYDVTEDDPYKGGAIYAGMGIGEHYMGPTWEDRGVMARGPSLVSLKDACREVLLNQGIDEDDIPHVLRPRPKPRNYDELVEAGRADQQWARSLNLHNVTGYGPKPISIYKAMMYTLMPPGSVLIMPDFVWQSPLWAACAVGGALRGTRSYIIFPSEENQPSPVFLSQSRSHEMFTRLIVVNEVLKDEMAASGGVVECGFYHPDMDVGDLRGRVNQLFRTVRRYDFMSELFAIDPDDSTGVLAANKVLDDLGFAPVYTIKDAKERRPQLHLKAQFIASGEFWDRLVSFREWDAERPIITYVRERGKQLKAQAREEYIDPTDLQDAVGRSLEPFIRSVLENMSREEIEKMMMYLSVGSQNQDFRGMFLDGEVTYLTSGLYAIYGLIDFIFIMGLCDWVHDLEDLDEYVPGYGWLKRHISRLATPLM